MLDRRKKLLATRKLLGMGVYRREYYLGQGGSAEQRRWTQEGMVSKSGMAPKKGKKGRGLARKVHLQQVWGCSVPQSIPARIVLLVPCHCAAYSHSGSLRSDAGSLSRSV